MTRRLAAALALLLLAGALVATFAPASALGSTCGTWVAPEYDREEVAALVARGDQLATDLDALGGDTGKLAAGGQVLTAAYLECSDKLDTRQLLALTLLALALATPAAIMFVAGREKLSSTGTEKTVF